MRKGLSFYDKQHVQKVLVQQNEVANIFNRFILSITPYLRQWDDRGGNSVWVRNQSVEKRIDNELMNLSSQLIANASLFQFDAWKRSDMKNDDFIREYIKGMSINSAVKEGMFAHNLSALAQLQNDFDARGNKLSSSVWNLADQTKTQLEYYLKAGLSTGQNASRISQDVRQILNEPDKRFRRIKNDDGVLVLSQPMRDYHPGQGVYRSAKMNALRLTTTTTNMAYRSADYDRWSKQDFVLGIQIQRSANNRGPCKLCDSMVGEYPKTFKFTGFHPFCICVATPIVMNPEELANYLLDGIIPDDKVVKDIPKGAEKFIDENKNARKNSYWYSDNFDKDGKLTLSVNALNKPSNETKSLFVESKSIEDAQNFAKQFVKKNPMDKTFKGEINYSGISIENANEINKAIANLYNSIDVPFISGIKSISPTSVQGKKIFKDGADAIAAYSPIEKGIFLNKETLKSSKTFSGYVKRSNDAWDVVMSKIDKLTPSQKEIAIKYKNAGRSLVDESIQGCITHEFGHHIQWQMLPVELNNKLGANMGKYAERISGYANASKSEYLAESVAAYIKGETSKIDPVLVEYLDSKKVIKKK